MTTAGERVIYKKLVDSACGEGGFNETLCFRENYLKTVLIFQQKHGMVRSVDAEKLYERKCFFKNLLIKAGVSPHLAETDACRMERVISEESFQ